MSAKTKTVGVDFDGVIHAYRKGWHDGTIYDGPVEGAFDALWELLEKYAVFVFTTRECISVARWLQDHGFHAVPDLREDSGEIFWHQRGIILVTNRKLAAIAYIDDRGIQFLNWEQALDDLRCFDHDDQRKNGNAQETKATEESEEAKAGSEEAANSYPGYSSG